MATTYTFTVRAGVTLVDASVSYNGTRYDVDAQLAAGGGSIVTADENLATLLKQLRASDGALLDVNGVPGAPDPALTPLLPVYGPSGLLAISSVQNLQTTLDANAAAATAYANSVGGGVQLGYAELVSDFTTATTGADVTGLAITITAGTRPILVVFETGALSNSSGAGAAIVNIQEGATVLRQASIGAVTANLAFCIHREVYIPSPSAGSHTYKVNLSSFGAGTVTLAATAANPAYIQALQI